MGSKTRLGSYCTKRANNGVNLVTSRKINTRLARPMHIGNSITKYNTNTNKNHNSRNSKYNDSHYEYNT